MAAAAVSVYSLLVTVVWVSPWFWLSGVAAFVPDSTGRTTFVCQRQRHHSNASWLRTSNSKNNPTSDLSVVVQENQDNRETDDNDPSSTTTMTAATALAMISDAEALIACRNYLQRRKRWGNWDKAQERKEQRKKLSFQARQLQQNNPMDGTGFFWEDPSALRYLHKSNVLLHGEAGAISDEEEENDEDDDQEGFETGDDESHFGTLHTGPDTTAAFVNDDDDDDLDDEEDEIWESVKLQGAMGRRDILPLVLDQHDVRHGGSIGTAGEEFSPFYETGPSEEHVRRSHAKQQMWADPEWRDKWYQKRWGGKKQQQQQHQGNQLYSKNQKALEHRLQQIDLDAVLEHPALAEMTQEEIDQAIIEYTRLKRKKKITMAKSDKDEVSDRETTDVKNAKATPSQRRKKSKPAKRRDASAGLSALEQFVLATENNQNQQAQQQALREQRAEKARKAYQKRLEKNREKQNQAEKANEAATGTTSSRSRGLSKYASKEQTPQAALWRIEAALDSCHDNNDNKMKTLPAASDVELILQPQRLSRRKQVLLRIIQEGLGLRGKCIPTDRSDGTFQFASTASIPALGKFILAELRKQET